MSDEILIPVSEWVEKCKEVTALNNEHARELVEEGKNMRSEA